MNVNDIMNRAARLCYDGSSASYRNDGRAIKYAFLLECIRTYDINNETNISRISRSGFNTSRFVIEFMVGRNILYIDKNDDTNKEFLELIRTSDQAIVCEKSEDIFSAPRGVIFLDLTNENEDLYDTAEFVIGSQSILICCTDGKMCEDDYIEFEFDGCDYISKIQN